MAAFIAVVFSRFVSDNTKMPKKNRLLAPPLLADDYS